MSSTKQLTGSGHFFVFTEPKSAFIRFLFFFLWCRRVILMYSSLVVEEFQMLFPSMLLMLGELFSTILITTIAVCMSLTLCLCSSVINELVKSSSLGFGVRLDPGVRPTSPLNLIINKNFNSDTALNSYWLFSNPSQYSLFALPPPPRILRKLLFSKWYSWEYAVLPGAFENSPSCPSWRETLKFPWFLLGRITFSHVKKYRSRFYWMCHFSHVRKTSFAPLIG